MTDINDILAGALKDAPPEPEIPQLSALERLQTIAGQTVARFAFTRKAIRALGEGREVEQAVLRLEEAEGWVSRALFAQLAELQKEQEQ